MSPHQKSGEDRLAEYRRKRTAGATPEPFGGERIERPGMFVIQMHDARRRHYDLRIEMEGVLRSWAVPKGPSLDTAEKRLAVATEDHPIEYADFEGVIPEGNYGAGAVIVWDRGVAEHHIDPVEGFADGKLLFELRGHKLSGLWTLVRTSRNPKDWLLIKKPDPAATGETAEELGLESVFSGLTVEELAGGTARRAEMVERLKDAGARRRKVDAATVRPMLAKLEREPFTREGWLFELKYDGYRVMASKFDEEIVLRYRSGGDTTAIYPELERVLRSLPFDNLLLDGEVVVLDGEARPDFAALQSRARLSRKIDVQRASTVTPAVLYVFDLLACEGYDLRSLPLTERKNHLKSVLPKAGALRYTDHVETRGEALYEAVRSRGLEGIVGKRSDAPYRAGRSGRWIKIRSERTGDFVVIGYTDPKGGRPGFGALHLAQYDAEGLRYVGRVGTGFTDELLVDLHHELSQRVTKNVTCRGDLPTGGEHHWVKPENVVEVRFLDFTAAGHLRHPVYERARPDKKPIDCVDDESPPAPEEISTEPVKDLRLSRLEKVFWPNEGFTKGDLISYYDAISPWILPYLKNRPTVLDRYPDGVEGKSFFQKNAPEFTPDWVPTEVIWSSDGEKQTRYFIPNDRESLLHLANSGSVPLHVWASRLNDLQKPDWSILDLDAKQAEFIHVVTVAKAIHRLCREIDLPAYVKTSGATGLHILLPLGGACTHAQSKLLAELLAQVVSRQLPDIASVHRTPSAREGKVYIDALQNGFDKLLVSPLCVRPLPGAPVSMPLRWREVTPRLDPERYTIENAPRRMKRLGEDPMLEVLTQRPNLVRALGALSALVS